MKRARNADIERSKLRPSSFWLNQTNRIQSKSLGPFSDWVSTKQAFSFFSFFFYSQDRGSRPASLVVRPDACQEPQSRLQQSHQSHQVISRAWVWWQTLWCVPWLKFHVASLKGSLKFFSELNLDIIQPGFFIFSFPVDLVLTSSLKALNANMLKSLLSFFYFCRGQIINIRYLAYFDNILDFIKDRILVYHG